ncbi:hypothetical protein [Stenotrophomonas sp. S41]|uniref:hypothetical protein n=1 Tax=Stenotrophomonas sp. S41 TaxID=2767464 RepID=UPI00190CE717|nr:hypothetical protein [Stenotrophomonas sp. S41]MBK0010807.1 hypothetical protein [Stenotrophomonas sp. S41]
MSSEEVSIIRRWIRSDEKRSGDADLEGASNEIISKAFQRDGLNPKSGSVLGAFRFDLYQEGMLIPDDVFIDPPLEAERFVPR